MATHTCGSSTRKTEAEDHKFQSSLAIHSSRPCLKTKLKRKTISNLIKENAGSVYEDENELASMFYVSSGNAEMSSRKFSI